MTGIEWAIVLGIFGLAIPLGLLGAARARRRITDNPVYDRFKTLYEAQGLEPLDHKLQVLRTFFVGEWRGHRVMANFDTGRRGSGIHQKAYATLYMESGAMPRGTWSAHLADGSIKSTSGKGGGKETLLGLLDGQVLAMAKHFPLLSLNAAGNLLKGSPVEMAIAGRWPDGWQGLIIHAALPFDSTEGDIRLGLERMADMRAALREAGGVKD